MLFDISVEEKLKVKITMPKPSYNKHVHCAARRAVCLGELRFIWDRALLEPPGYPTAGHNMLCSHYFIH